MRQMRARAFALRDVFPDVLRGMPVAEELQDMDTSAQATPVEKNMGPAEVVLPLQYRVQMEHQMMVSGSERSLFMASEWTGDGQLVEERHCWYEPDAEAQ